MSFGKYAMTLMDSFTIGKQIRAAFRTNRILQVLLDSEARSGPFDGGCLIVAKALYRIFESGDLVRIMSTENGGQTEHYGLRIKDYIFDAFGVHTSPAHWVAQLRNELPQTRNYYFAVGFDAASEIPDDPCAVKLLSHHLEQPLLMLLLSQQRTMPPRRMIFCAQPMAQESTGSNRKVLASKRTRDSGTPSQSI